MDSNSLVHKINSIKINSQINEDQLRIKFCNMFTPESKVLDCGKSLRDSFESATLRYQEVKTIDINSFADYPDYLADICDFQQMKRFESSFDAIACFSLLEHCYNPFTACENLYSALKPNGVLVGSAPFLFPRHSPENLEYQDYFRFTRDAYAVLFPASKQIELFPLRGRIATSLNVLSTRYRFNFESLFPRLSSRVNSLSSSGRQALQTSGYGFIISK